MNSRQRPESVPFLSRRDRFRLLLLVGGFAAVVMAFQWARQPESWIWLAPEQPDAPEATDEHFRIAGEDDDGQPPLGPDEFLAGGGAEHAVTEPTAASLESGSAAVEAGADAGSRNVQLPPEMLSGVQDNRLGIRREEAELFYEVLARARDVSPAQLKEASRTDLVHAHFMVDPDVYRGKVVTLRGELRRLLPFRAGENAFGLETLYEGWLFTPDSGLNPFRIVFSEPPEIPTGEEISRPVSVTGYFFKLEGYASEGGLHVAPLILARQIEPREQMGVPLRDDTAIVPYVAGLLGLIVIGLGFVLWNFAVSDMVYRRSRARAITEPNEADLAAMQNVEPVPVWEQLGRLNAAVADAPPADESADDATDDPPSPTA